jgi:hypothetical protein
MEDILAQNFGGFIKLWRDFSALAHQSCIISLLFPFITYCTFFATDIWLELRLPQTNAHVRNQWDYDTSAIVLPSQNLRHRCALSSELFLFPFLIRMDNENSFWYIGVLDCGKKSV